MGKTGQRTPVPTPTRARTRHIDVGSAVIAVAVVALLAIAGGVFRTYVAQKNVPGADRNAVALAHANYVTARNRALTLRVCDVAAIKAVLGGEPSR